YSRKFEDSYQRILSSKSQFPQLQLGIIDSFMEEIDLFLTPDDPMPPRIEDDEDSEGDILFLERLLHDDPIPLPDTLDVDFSYEVRIFLPFFTYPLSSIPGNLKTLAKGFYPPSLTNISANPGECEHKFEGRTTTLRVTLMTAIEGLCIGLNELPWNELDLPEFTTIEQAHLLARFVGQGNDQGLGANGVVDGVNENVEGVNKLVDDQGPTSSRPKIQASVSKRICCASKGSSSSEHPYPSRMLKQKQQEKDEVQIQNFWQMFKQLHINITFADALILMPKYHKMLKALLSNKEKLQELANIPLIENCTAVILKKLPEKLRDPGKVLIACGFSELKCKALADLGASINLMQLSIWKKLGLPELIPTQMTLELANRANCTPTGIARDVFVPVGKFTFPADFVIIDYESDPRFDIESNLKEIEILLYQGKDFSLNDSIDQKDLANLADICVDLIPEMFTDEHALDYSSPLIFDVYDDDYLEVESDAGNVYDDPFDSKEEKIKESKLLIDELDLPCDCIPPSEYDSFDSQDFSRVDALPSTNNEDKVFNPGILIHEKPVKIISCCSGKEASNI
nr:reverse transcriptase domain-containing protein [Tanacetum cinerariifolium]